MSGNGRISNTFPQNMLPPGVPLIGHPQQVPAVKLEDVPYFDADLVPHISPQEGIVLITPMASLLMQVQALRNQNRIMDEIVRLNGLLNKDEE